MVAAPKQRPAVVPTEVSPKATRRTYTAEYKRKILAEVDACTKPGEIGALLRREGIYSSHLVDWRRARERGDLEVTRKRGPKVRQPDDRDRAIADLERELRRQKARADRAEALVDLQKKVAELLNLSSGEPNERSR